jgi:hypothetical protein
VNFAVTAQVVLFDRNGSPITSQTVALPGHSRRAVAIGGLLRQANSVETMGSVEVLPDPAKVVTMAVAAQISISGSGAGLGQQIEEEFLPVGMPGSGVLRAAGASLLSDPVVALKNTAAAAQTATLSCITERGAATRQQVQLRAGGWALLRACTSSPDAAVSLLGTALTPPAGSAASLGAFGVSVTGSGQPGSLAPFGFSWHGAARGALLSSQNFLDAGTFRSGNTVFTGVPVGAANYLPGAIFAPQVALTNFGAQPVHATVVYAHTSDSGPQASNVATVSVPGMSARTVMLPDLTGDPALRSSFIVQSDAAPGALFASLAAVGAPGFGLVEQIGKDELTPANGGGHPWDLTGGQDAVLLLFNHSRGANYFNVKIGNGGVLWQQPYQLAPMETRAISIRDLIADRVKDQDGKLLPETVEQGEISWFNPNPAEGKGRLMQIDPALQTVAGNTRVARNFSCGYNLVLCGAYLATASIIFSYGSSSSPLYLGPVIPLICTAYNPYACSGQSYGQGGSGYNYSWESTIPSIATVYGSTTSSTAAFWGNAAGTGGAAGFVASANCQEGGSGTPTVTPRIMFGRNDVTNKTTTVVVGQPIALTASYTLPTGVSVKSQSWTVRGNVVSNYSQSNTAAVVTTYTSPSSTATTFYWIDGGTNTVSYSVTLSDNSGPFTAQATFNVLRPTSSFSSTTGTVQVCTSYCASTPPMLAFGDNTTDGITWNVTVTTPADGAGNVALTQVVQVTNTHILDPQGTQQTLTTGSAYVLDGTPQYPGTPVALPASREASFAIRDAPGTTLATSIKHQSDSESFKTYLMYQPSGGIWVTLASMTWSWGGAATKGSGNVMDLRLRVFAFHESQWIQRYHAPRLE